MPSTTKPGPPALRKKANNTAVTCFTNPDRYTSRTKWCYRTNSGRSTAVGWGMDERDFKRHLRDLAHGHHHPEEHDWQGGQASPTAKAPRKTAARKRSAAGRKSSTKRR